MLTYLTSKGHFHYNDYTKHCYKEKTKTPVQYKGNRFLNLNNTHLFIIIMKKYTPLPPDRDDKYLGLLTKDKSFYQTFFPLLIVIALQQLTTLAVNMADNIMLGRYTELALSGATLVNQLQFILHEIAGGIGMGIVVLCAQYWGQKRIQPIKDIIGIGVKFAFVTGMIFFGMAKLFPVQILSLFTYDTAVIAEASHYLNIICFTYIIFAISNSLMYSLQSVETASIGTAMAISTLCINICLNYVLIYGNLGAPELGIRGAALATLTSRTIELLIILIYLFFIDKKLQMKLSDLFRFNKLYLKDFIRTASPIIISGMMWGVAQAVQTSILGHISAAAIAANSIAVVVFQIFAVLGFSCSNAASVTIGKTIGAERLDMVRSYAKTMQVIFLITGMICGGMIFIFKDLIVSFYTISEETKALAISFLTVFSVSAVGTCYEVPAMNGIIAGGGDTRYSAIIDNLFMWLFTIPAAALSAFVFGWPPLVTFILLKADQILKCIPNAIVCNRYRWVRILTK